MQLMRDFQFVVFALCCCSFAAIAGGYCLTNAIRRHSGLLHALGSMAIPDSAMVVLLASSQATHMLCSRKAVAHGVCWIRLHSGTSLLERPPTFRLAKGSTLLMPVAQFSRAPL